MTFIDLFFPKSCLGCKKDGSYICTSCLEKVKPPIQICPECKKPSIDGFTHVKCRKKYGLDGIFTIWEYSGVVRNAVISLKYKYATDIGKELTVHILKSLERMNLEHLKGYHLVPIPIYWHRKNTRGFNQSVELGKPISLKMDWNMSNVLKRDKNTVPQAQLSRDARKKNIRGVFALRDSEFVTGGSYLLFDDVYTTGSTIKEASKVLKRKGAKSVWGLTICR